MPKMSDTMEEGVLALCEAELDLDQLMIVQGPLEFGLNAFCQSVLGYDQDRFQMVADGFVLLLLLVGERHMSTLASEP